jgi:hypothetical protein
MLISPTSQVFKFTSSGAANGTFFEFSTVANALGPANKPSAILAGTYSGTLTCIRANCYFDITTHPGGSDTIFFSWFALDKDGAAYPTTGVDTASNFFTTTGKFLHQWPNGTNRKALAYPIDGPGGFALKMTITAGTFDFTGTIQAEFV